MKLLTLVGVAFAALTFTSGASAFPNLNQFFKSPATTTVNSTPCRTGTVLMPCPVTDPTTFLARVVKSIAGKDVPVTCPSKWPYGTATGYTTYNPLAVYLDADTCAWLTLLAADPNDRKGTYLNGTRTRFEEADALETLVHESEHVSGIVNESQAECAALAILGRVASEQFHITNTGPIAEYAQLAHEQKPSNYREGC